MSYEQSCDVELKGVIGSKQKGGGSTAVSLLTLLLLLPQSRITNLLALLQLVLSLIPRNNPLSQLFEHLPHILIIFGTAFYEFDVVLLSKCLSLLASDLAIVVHIAFGGYQNHVGLLIAHLSDLVDPVFDVGVAVGVGYRVSQNNAMSSLVERFGDVSEAFLSGGIPDIESDLASIMVSSFDFEVYANSAEVISLEGVFAIADQEAGFANTAVTDNQVLEGDALVTAHYQFKVQIDQIYQYSCKIPNQARLQHTTTGKFGRQGMQELDNQMGFVWEMIGFDKGCKDCLWILVFSILWQQHGNRDIKLLDA